MVPCMDKPISKYSVQIRLNKTHRQAKHPETERMAGTSYRTAVPFLEALRAEKSTKLRPSLSPAPT